MLAYACEAVVPNGATPRGQRDDETRDLWEALPYQ